MKELNELLDELEEQRTSLVNNLTKKGVTASESEGFTSLVPKVLDVSVGSDVGILNDLLMGNEIDFYKNTYITRLSFALRVKNLYVPNVTGKTENNFMTFIYYPENMVCSFTQGGTGFLSETLTGKPTERNTIVFLKPFVFGMNNMYSISFKRIIFADEVTFGTGNALRDTPYLTSLVLKHENMVLAGTGTSFIENSRLRNADVDDAFVYVPKSIISEYQSDPTWTALGVKFRAIEDYPEVLEYEYLFEENA